LIKALVSSKISITFGFRLFDAGRRSRTHVCQDAPANSLSARP